MIYELLIGLVVYALLFAVTVQSSRRKVTAMQERLDKVRALQVQQLAQSAQSIAQNEAKIMELESLLKKLGDENSFCDWSWRRRRPRLHIIIRWR